MPSTLSCILLKTNFQIQYISVSPSPTLSCGKYRYRMEPASCSFLRLCICKAQFWWHPLCALILVPAEQLGLLLTKLDFHFSSSGSGRESAFFTTMPQPAAFCSTGPLPVTSGCLSSFCKQFRQLFFSQSWKCSGFISDLWCIWATGCFFQSAKPAWQCWSVRNRKTCCCTSAL